MDADLSAGHKQERGVEELKEVTLCDMIHGASVIL